LADLTAEIVNRYRFASYPTQPNPAQTAKFETGVAVLGGINMPITDLQIFSDGVIVTSRNTDDADAVLDDFFIWAIPRFGLREPTTKLPRTYTSKIIVEFDTSLDKFVSNFESMKKILAEKFNSKEELHAIRLTIGPHPAGTFPYMTTWQIEPRSGQPFVPNRYFSSAPLSTAAHIEMLDALEAAGGR
jgi:hypothetical protein